MILLTLGSLEKTYVTLIAADYTSLLKAFTKKNRLYFTNALISQMELITFNIDEHHEEVVNLESEESQYRYLERLALERLLKETEKIKSELETKFRAMLGVEPEML